MNDITVIIPTINRHEYLKRTINIYKKNNVKFKVIVVDSTAKPLDLSFFKDAPFVKYFHKPEIKSGREAQKFALNNTFTKYCIYHGDDDFLLQFDLKFLEDFLNNNDDYSAAAGQMYSFKLKNDQPKGELLSLNHYPTINLEETTPIQRLKKISRKYTVIFFYVTHTKYLKESMEIGNPTSLQEFKDEIFHVFYLSMVGKIKIMQFNYLLRQTHSNHFTMEKSLDTLLVNEQSFLTLLNSIDLFAKKFNYLNYHDDKLKNFLLKIVIRYFYSSINYKFQDIYFLNKILSKNRYIYKLARILFESKKKLYQKLKIQKLNKKIISKSIIDLLEK